MSLKYEPASELLQAGGTKVSIADTSAPWNPCTLDAWSAGILESLARLHSLFRAESLSLTPRFSALLHQRVLLRHTWNRFNRLFDCLRLKSVKLDAFTMAGGGDEGVYCRHPGISRGPQFGECPAVRGQQMATYGLTSGPP